MTGVEARDLPEDRQNLSSLLVELQEVRLRKSAQPIRVTDRDLNQYEEVLENGVYIRRKIGNKRDNGGLTEEEANYYLDKTCSKIMDHMFLASGDVAKDKQLLLHHQITHVLNLSTGVGEPFVGDFIYLSKRITDTPSENLLAILDECLAFIHNVRSEGKRVLVHCNQGVSRSASVVIAYLIRFEKLPYAQAFIQTANARPIIRPNYGFEQQLQRFAEMELGGDGQA